MINMDMAKKIHAPEQKEKFSLYVLWTVLRSPDNCQDFFLKNCLKGIMADLYPPMACSGHCPTRMNMQQVWFPGHQQVLISRKSRIFLILFSKE
jgi:hypothetical protein